jgi:hypothetical protein
MDWTKLAGKAKQVIDKRGGKKSVAEDATELRDIAKGEGTLADKGKQAAAAIKEPGAPGADTSRTSPGPRA